jgi:hypothetical protein
VLRRSSTLPYTQPFALRLWVWLYALSEGAGFD